MRLSPSFNGRIEVNIKYGYLKYNQLANFQLLSLDSFTRKFEENETNMFSHNSVSLLTQNSSTFLMAFKVFWTFLSYLSGLFLLLSNSSVVSCLFQSNDFNWKFCMSNNVVKLTPSTSKHGLKHLVWHKKWNGFPCILQNC